MQLFLKKGVEGGLPIFLGAGEEGRGGAAGELPYLRWAAQTLEERAVAGDWRSGGATWAVSVARDGGTWGRDRGHGLGPSGRAEPRSGLEPGRVGRLPSDRAWLN